MPPRNYTHSNHPQFFSQGSSALMRAEFDSIQAGFSGVEGEIDDLTAEVNLKETKVEVALKAYHTGDTYTGTHDFKTATVEVANPTTATHAVSKLYADNLVFTNVLPAQTGNAGKMITTDGEFAQWTEIHNPSIYRSARTSNTALAFADRETLIDITSGTFTQTFAACSSLEDGWWCIIRNAGTGDITLDPDGSEQIDGLDSYIMYPGEARLIQCDGTALRSIVINPFYKTFTISGTFHKPPGYQRFAGLLWGAGGSGRKDSSSSNKSGGGGGACTPFDIPASSFSTSETITIGDGGTAITTNATGGNTGGSSTVGSLVWAGGGTGGGTSIAYGGDAFFSGTTNDLGAGTTSGAYGGGPSHYSAAYKTIWGGAGGGGITSADALENGHVTIYGGACGASSLASNGGDGTAPGGGGGATKTGTQSGAGARGELRIWGVA